MATPNVNTFEDALEDFKKGLNPKQIQNFQFVTLNDVRETALRIQSEQDQTKSLMNMTRLEGFLEAMEQFGKVIGIFVNASTFVAFVWGPMKFFLLTANTWADSFEILLDAYGQLGEHIPLLEQYHSLFGSSTEMQTVLVMMYKDILSFHKEATRFFSGKVWKQLFRSMWKNFATTFKHILDNLNCHRQLITEQATLINFHRQGCFFQQYERDGEERFRVHQERKQAEERSKYLQVLEWFSAARSIQQDHNTFLRARSHGTGDWILKEEKVRNWLEVDVPESSILWINGIPGAGKTILTSIIINSCSTTDEKNTTYFYCKENDSEKNNCISIYRGLLSQMLNNHRDLIPYCHDRMSSTGEINLTTTNLAENLLKVLFEKAENTRVVIDGLDECDANQRKLLLAFFTDTVDLFDEKDPGKLRVLFVSQDYLDIQKALQSATVLKLTNEDNEADIKLYVREWSLKFRLKYELHPKILEEIQESTCARAKGMFLFAKLVMQHLYDLETQDKVLNEIQFYGFPAELGEAYERIIGRLHRTLSEAQWDVTRKLMGWMVCAKRPLRWREIQAAVSMKPEYQTFDFDKEKLRSSIQYYCGTLIQVLPGDRVELVHATAKMHIASSNYISRSLVDTSLATLCLQYLTFEIFTSEIDDEHLKRSIQAGALSLQDYVVAKWMEHIHMIVTNKSCLLPKDPCVSDQTTEVTRALDEFSTLYETDILEYEMTTRVEQDCEAFQMLPLYENLLNIWNHASEHASKGSSAKDKISIKQLRVAVMRSREILEKITAESSPQSLENAELDVLYGEKRFKCPKVTCYYFHEGFKDVKSRDLHINRHDRPFSCSFPDCSIVEFGFSTNKDLEKHRRFFHPEMEEQANSFNAIAKTTTLTPFECNICGKKFTRGFIHKHHLLSHTGTRPHACSECGKAFTRANDCKRHEKIHEKRR
ncbi:hypothetical protein BKA65DRAFT_40515 [Rhexocercosporidium sp. MPI-PUGE-AT-0058]|nr:hypothetical protein BKA65DRAFT_40515 [Rhexocercosporidium sp. MPI-PUGE-AT-0058]